MTKAMPFLQKVILLSYDPRPLDRGFVRFTGVLSEKSDSALNLARTQTTGAGVDVARGPVHHRLYAPHVGLPASVGSSVGVGNLDAEGNALSTNVAFSHESAPPFQNC